jgi:hypothetical protein
MRVQDVIDQARDFLQDRDPDPAYRYSDVSLVRLINLSMYEIRRVRPDYFIGAYEVPVPQYSLMLSEIQVPETALPAIVKYIVGMAELRDDEYTTDGRAAALLQAFSVDLGVR